MSYLRDKGSSLGRITIGEEYDADEDAAFEDPGAINLVHKVTTKAPFHIACPPQYSKGIHIAVLDCGAKENILRCLVERGASLTVFLMIILLIKLLINLMGYLYLMVPGSDSLFYYSKQFKRKL